MKIILSRKGFDSSSGKQPNPIMPDGTLLSLPIPDEAGNNEYSSLFWNGKSFYDIINSLKPGTKLTPYDKCHLDPDLRKEVRNRLPHWKPAFGQTGAALSHLRNLKVDIGDLFLFFGWYRATEEKNGKLIYKKNSPHQHIIYGYMQIGDIIERYEDVPNWLKNHPHVLNEKAWKDNANAIYLPTDSLSFLPYADGCGVLNYRSDRVLTKEGMTRRHWDLPEFFKKVEISYHSKDSWANGCFKSTGRGQEFVMEATHEIENWAKSLIL